VNVSVVVGDNEDGGRDPSVDDVVDSRGGVTSVFVLRDIRPGYFNEVIVTVSPFTENAAAGDDIVYVSRDKVTVNIGLKSEGIMATDFNSDDGDLGGFNWWVENVVDLCVAVSVAVEYSVIVEPRVVVFGVSYLEFLDPLIVLGTSLGGDT